MQISKYKNLLCTFSLFKNEKPFLIKIQPIDQILNKNRPWTLQCKASSTDKKKEGFSIFFHARPEASIEICQESINDKRSFMTVIGHILSQKMEHISRAKLLHPW